jgi:hypothetical protein
MREKKKNCTHTIYFEYGMRSQSKKIIEENEMTVPTEWSYYLRHALLKD